MLLALCTFAEAQQSSKVYRVGRLSGSLSSSTFSLDALRRELRDLGYIEGKNIAFEHRNAEEKPERLPALAAVLWFPKSGSSEPQWTESQLAARQLGLQLHSMEIGNTDKYENASKRLSKRVAPLSP